MGQNSIFSVILTIHRFYHKTIDTQDSLHCGITASCERSSAAVHREITRPKQDPKGETTSVQQHIDDHSLHRAQDEHIAQQIQHLQEEQEEVADSTGSPPSKRRKCSSIPTEIHPDDVNEIGDTDNLEFCTDEPQLETFKLRNYQMELVEPALEGRNTIICAPTGSGKTITALYIMQRHLVKGFTANRPHRIVFLVNQKPLVEQQGNVFEEYLIPMNYRVIQLTGDTATIPMAEVVEEGYDVMVLTAQILVNALKDNIISSLSVFTMLIFDECHHTQKLEPYNDIMARYRDMKIDHPKQPRPQIIGLTASLGVGKSKTQQLAMEHILKICANLDADNISTVVKNKNELQRYAPVPDEALLSVQGRVEDPFFKIVSEIMLKIETDMLSSEGTDAIDPKVLKPPSERGTQSYEHWVVNLGKQSIVVLTDDKIGRMFTTCTDHLRKYNDSLFVNKDARTKDALQYLNKYFDNLENKRQGFDKLDEDLFQLFKENKPELEKVAADPQYKNPKDKPDSRCIILTTTRASCYALKSWMEETPEFVGLNPGVLIGGGGSGDNPGMTETQQRNLLEKFKEGNHSIIVCTSVGQEGIDIQLCNLVFRYNYANNEIGRVQAIGRSRVNSGKTFLVAVTETGVMKRKQLNMTCEKT
ncbi:antiviral innate immune response receptor RIG-I-like [Ptychodera flava]|uniref:antiviral innate immune response receptor RIG-I-like n=1 Tax=Ptychodera flava TaxID=63121 RepID=UPI00396A73BF